MTGKSDSGLWVDGQWLSGSVALRVAAERNARRQHRQMAIAGLVLVLVLVGLIGATTAMATVGCRDLIEKETSKLTATEPETWSAWSDWPGAGPLVDDGRARGPLPHGGTAGRVGFRLYRYVVVGKSAGCVTPTTSTTTVPPTTIPETTVATTVPESTTTTVATTVPPTTVAVATDLPPVPPDSVPLSTESVETVPPATETTLEVPAASEPVCEEDEPCWDCSTMGNGICGPVPLELPATGNETTVLALIAGLFVFAGGGLGVIARRR